METRNDDEGLFSCSGMFWIDAARHLHLDDSLGEIDEFSCIERSQTNCSGSSLKKEDMVVHGLCPARDELFLVVCEQCRMLVKPQALDYHIDLRHRRGIGESHSAVIPSTGDAMYLDRQVTRKRHAVKPYQSPAEESRQRSSCRRQKSRRAKVRGRRHESAASQSQSVDLKETNSCKKIGELLPNVVDATSKSVLVDREVGVWKIIENGTGTTQSTRLCLHRAPAATITSGPNCRPYVVFRDRIVDRSTSDFSTACQIGSVVTGNGRAGVVRLQEESTLKPHCYISEAGGDNVPSTGNNLATCLPFSFHHRKLPSCSALPPTSMENSISVTHNDHSECSFSVPLSILPSPSISHRFTSASTPAVHVEVLYSLEDPVYEEKIYEEKIVESNAQPSLANGSLLRGVCNSSAEGVSVQPSVLVPFRPQFHSEEAKINFSDRSRCVQQKEVQLTGLEEQNLLVASGRSSSACESTRKTFSSSDAIVLKNSLFAQNLSLSTCHQSFDSSNQFTTFATADSLETVQYHRSMFPIWTACSVESSPNPTFFNVMAHSVESSQELSTNLVVSEDVGVDLSSFSTVLTPDYSSVEVPRSVAYHDKVAFIGELISSENVPSLVTLSHLGSHVGPVPQVASAVSHFSNKFHAAAAAATPTHPLSVGTQVLTSAQVPYAKSWLCQVGGNDS